MANKQMTARDERAFIKAERKKIQRNEVGIREVYTDEEHHEEMTREYVGKVPIED